MDTAEHERYVFLRFASASVDEALRILAEDNDDLPLWTRYAALRYAVVCYFRPFTRGDTRFVFTQPNGSRQKKLALPLGMVPPAHADLHAELSVYRHSAYAHTDIVELNPRLHYWPSSSVEFGIAFKPIDKKPLHLQKSRMLDLFKAVRAKLTEEMRSAEDAIRREVENQADSQSEHP